MKVAFTSVENHLIGTAFKSCLVKIKDLFFKCFFILYIQIDLLCDGFYWSFQRVVDEAFKALVAENAAIGNAALEDIITVKLFQPA